MKIREIGMPGEVKWNEFFEPYKALKTLGLDDSVSNVADFGCGHGTFTIPATNIAKGNVFAIDIEPELIESTKQKATVKN
ncbi:MAG: methyltransferase domain-containing protein [Methanohalobium sp.]|uniref:methyltransferase domain-containing protein n=1 Tax=Methanohalobium sp. TaxID=2837493 RepID=UPI00397D86F9